MDDLRKALVLSCLAEIHATNARIEAMKAANAAREHRGEAQAYDEAAFHAKADDLDIISSRIIEVARD